MEFDFNKKYLILSGSTLENSNLFALTCDPNIQVNAELKFSTNFNDAFNDPRCHFTFEKNNYKDKDDNLKYFIKSSYKDLFLSFCPGIDLFDKIADISIKAVLTDGTLNFCKYSIQVQKEDFCNYQLFGIYINPITHVIERFNLSSYKDITKGRNLVLSTSISNISINKEKTNFFFKIFPLDEASCYTNFIFSTNDSNIENERYTIFTSNNYKALTCENGIQENSEIKPLIPYISAINDIRCNFYFKKVPTLSKLFYKIYTKDSSGNIFYLITNGPVINEFFIFGNYSKKIILTSKYGDDYRYLFDLSPLSCFYKLYGILPERKGFSNFSIYRISTYKGDGPLVLSAGYDDESAGYKSNFLFRIVKNSENNKNCNYLYPPAKLSNCPNNSVIIQSNGYFLDDNCQFTLDNYACLNIIGVAEPGVFNIINSNGEKLSLLMDENRKIFINFANKKEMLIKTNQDKLQEFTFIYFQNSSNNKEFVIKTTSTECIPNEYYLKFSKNGIVLDKTYKFTNEYLFKIVNLNQ